MAFYYRLFHTFLISALAIMLSGCQSAFGPRALESTHPAYNEAIIASINEQMLQNLVRMRYRDVPFFLEIGSVTASLSLGANAGVDAGVNFGGSENLSPGVGLSYTDRPTISYTPLQGEDLLKSLLSPLQLENILVLTQSGWNISRVFGLCFERINNLYNAPNASGPTPDTEPDYEGFNRLMDALRILQQNQLMEIGSDGEDGIVIKLVRNNARYKAEIDRVYDLLELDRNRDEFSLATDFLTMDNTQWTVRTRSISGLLYYLSHNVQAPPPHRGALVTDTRLRAGGGSFNWSDTPAGRLFRVNTSAEQPTRAYIATRYRGHWFYIQDTDLETKSTFTLLRQLFDLQAGQKQSTGPALTLPVR
ncbi:MAG: hypothetical protein OXD47_03990 [Gammaproteobacteria bacterium]|nr:hypothetical protein [Gammaproteobacteria bacterium]MCY4337941.1 hypothetical protein [Gammaproteobacteria bacterium]